MVLPQTPYLICQPILSALPSESLLATLNTTTWSNHNFLSPQLFAIGSQWSCSLLQSLLNTAPSDAINKSDTSVLGSEAPHGSTIQIQNPTHVDGLQSLRTWTLTTFWLHLPLSLYYTPALQSSFLSSRSPLPRGLCTSCSLYLLGSSPNKSVACSFVPFRYLLWCQFQTISPYFSS